jgi:hypothetical protein
VSRCSMWNGHFFLLLLPNVILAPEPVKADRARAWGHQRRRDGVRPLFQD